MGGRLPSSRKRVQPGASGLNRHTTDPGAAYWLENMHRTQEGIYRPRYGLKHIKSMAAGEITHLSRPGGYNHLLMLIGESGKLYKLDIETGTATLVATGWPTGPMASCVALVPGGATRWVAAKAQIGATPGPVFHYDLTTLTELTSTSPADKNYVGLHMQSVMGCASGDGSDTALQWSASADCTTWDVLYGSPPVASLGTVDAIVPFGPRETILFGPKGIGRVMGIPPRNLAFENVEELPIATPMTHVCKCKDRIFFCAAGPRVFQYVSPGRAIPIEPPLFRDFFLAAGTQNLRSWYDEILNEYVLWDRGQHIGYRYSLTEDRWVGILSYTGSTISTVGVDDLLGFATIDQGASTVDQATQPWGKGFMAVDNMILQYDPDTGLDATGSATTSAFTCRVETIPERADLTASRQLLSVQIHAVGSWTPYYRWRNGPEEAWTTVVGSAVTCPGRWDIAPSAVEYRELTVGAYASSAVTLRFHSFEIVEQVSGMPNG